MLIRSKGVVVRQRRRHRREHRKRLTKREQVESARRDHLKKVGRYHIRRSILIPVRGQISLQNSIDDGVGETLGPCQYHNAPPGFFRSARMKTGTKKSVGNLRMRKKPGRLTPGNWPTDEGMGTDSNRTSPANGTHNPNQKGVSACLNTGTPQVAYRKRPDGSLPLAHLGRGKSATFTFHTRPRVS